MNYLQAACEFLNVDITAVLSHRVSDDEISLVVDRGIKGCPKYTLPLSDLVVPEPVELHSLAGLSDDELREMASAAGIKGYARMKRDTLVERLQA